MKRYHSFMYQAGSWDKPQKVIVKVEAGDKGTNMPDYKSKAIYEKGYCARGAMELRIKENKLYLKSDRTPCSSILPRMY